MALQMSERNALIGSFTAAAGPTAVGSLGIDDLLISLADSVFEGDTKRARQIVMGGFAVLGIASAVAPVVVESITGPLGIVMMGVAGGLLGVAAQAFLSDVGGN